MTIPLDEFMARSSADPEVKREYDALAPEFEISAELLRARLRAGLSQAELARRMSTSQSAVARLTADKPCPAQKRYCGLQKLLAQGFSCACLRRNARQARFF